MPNEAAGDNNKSKKTDKPKQYKCETCGKICLSSTGLGKHNVIHTRQKSIECDVCLKMFTLPHNFKKHRKTHDEERDGQHECQTCHKKFFNRSGLNSHKRIHNTVKRYPCDVCGLTYKGNSSLLRHKVIHTGKKPHVCKTCGRSFTYAGQLKVHLVTHSGVKKYICNICNQSFAYSSCLIRHKKCHATLKPYVCEYCGKRESSLNRLKYHVMTHTRPYVCDICGKAFASSGARGKHKQIHTRDKKLRFKCDTCNEWFPYYLIAPHRKKCPANSFTCNICGKKQSRWKEINMHKRIHGSKKLLKCHICLKKGFPVVSKLSEHLRTHSEDQPCQCDLCEKSFHSQPRLIKHRKSCCKKNPARPRFNSDICHAVSTGGDGMNLPKKNIHGLENTSKSHKCSLCERTFQTAELLDAHKQYHTGQRMSDVVIHNHFDNNLDDEMVAEKATGVTYACFKCGMEFELMKELIEHNEHHCSH